MTTTTLETKITAKRCITIVIQIEGGVCQTVYGDAMPEGYALDIVLRDMDNIEAGDTDPVEQGDCPSYENADEHYF